MLEKDFNYAQGDTVPKIFLEQHQKYRNRTFIRKKRYGLWGEVSWEDSYLKIKHLSLGLMSLGLVRGDKACIIGDNDPEYFWAEIGIQAMGGVAVGIYIDATPDEIKYLAGHSDAKIIFAKDQEQVDKVLQIKEDLPNLKNIIYWEPKGLWFYEDPLLVNYESLLALGREMENQKENLFEEQILRGKGEDICIISYTSGTTGLPKGAMISHEYLISAIKNGLGVCDPWTPDDRYLSYIPPAWITEHGFWIMALLSGASINFPEAPETVQENIREIGPTVFCYTPRMWESLMSSNYAKITDSSRLKRWIWRRLFPYGSKYAELETKGIKPAVFLALTYKLVYKFLFKPVKDKWGFANVRSAWTGGAPLSPSCFGFFRSLGLPIKQIYGATEVMGACAHSPEDVKWETLGVILPNAKVKISEEGEILLTAEKIFSGYYKEPEKADQALLGGRWFRTGDAGFVNEDGHLVFLDRMKDMMSLASGDKYAPQYLEGHLKFSYFIKDVMVTAGPEKSYITALISIDYENVGKWAERNRINYTTYANLSQNPHVLELIRREVAEVNTRVPSAAFIQKFINLPKEFDPDEGELTRTRKIRRSFVEKKYENIISAMYADRKEATMDINVEYQDGRKDKFQIPIKIENVSKGAGNVSELSG
ncbi:MAG: long-chain fatty acid--CoA ligase [Desulfobacteraceae bacterium]|nr:MAG: long-chain fatty acid--CoA ligase [Desulfobacteraceae bacterium]